MISDPFVRLVLYLALAAFATWLVSLVLTQAKVPHPWHLVGTIIAGILLLFLAFYMSGLPLLVLHEITEINI